MATPPRVSENPEVQQQYLAQLALTAALVQALRQLWAATLPLSDRPSLERFRQGVSVLVEQFSTAAASIAADYYQAVRREAGVTTPIPAQSLRLVDPPPKSLVDAGLDWALAEIEMQLAAELESIEADAAALEAEAQRRVEAAAQKALTDVSRDQTVASALADASALGFRRVPRPGACAFCIVQALRSTTRKGLATDFKRYAPDTMGGEKHYGVYKSRGSAGESADQWFEGPGEAKFHDWCHCVIEPVFSPVEALPEWLQDMERLYDELEGGLNAFRRALRALRAGRDPEPPAIPELPAIGAPSPQIAALLDLLPQVA